MRRLLPLLFAALIAPLAPTHASASTEGSGVTFRVGLVGEESSLDIARDTTPLAREVWALQYPALTDYAESDLTAVPGLADSWSPSPDGLRYRYGLRAGLTWSDGTPITPSDVVASISRDTTGLTVISTPHAPVTPSMPSRRKSAWPLWRAYSCIMCIITSRSDTCSPHRCW